MAYETVNGYCWPQSVAPGERVALHLSSSGGRPVSVEVARVGRDPRGGVLRGRRSCRRSSHADRRARAGVRLARGGRDRGRRGVAFRLLRGAADDRRRRQAADEPGLLRRATRPRHDRLRGSCGRSTPTRGTPTTTSAGATSTPVPPRRRCCGRWRRATCTSRPVRASGSPSLHPPDHQSASHVGYLRMNHLSPWGGSAGWPNWSGRSSSGPSARATRSTSSPTPTSRSIPSCSAPDSPYSLYLSIGHDEYWSAPMRDTVEAFIARGGHAVFFSGNTSFWQVRLEDPTGPEGSGPAATMVGYKGFFKQDPVFGTDRQAELTTIWSDHLLERPENHMTGVSFSRGGYHRIGKRATKGAGGYTLHRPEHWIFDGTGLDYGDLLGAAATIVGYECDGCDFTYRDGLPYPTGVDGTPSNFEILGTAPAAHFTRTTASRPPRAARTVGDRVHLLAAVRRTQPRGGRTDRTRPRRARHLRDTRRRHGDHQRLHRLGLGPGRARPRRRADHPQHPRPPRRLTDGCYAGGLTPGVTVRRSGRGLRARSSRE